MLSEYLDLWLRDSVKETVRLTTYQGYERIVRLHIKPTLGRVKLETLTPTHLRSLYRERLEAGLAPRMVQLIHTTLHKALKQAAVDGLVSRNVAGMVRAPRSPGKEIRTLPTRLGPCFSTPIRTDWRRYTCWPSPQA
jgi:integrase